MEERKYADLRIDIDQDDKLATEVTIGGDKITPPENYLIGKITKVVNGMIVEFVKKQQQYPKTYEECCEIIHSDPKFYIDTHLYSDALEALYKLLICRVAYWKIAGEQMDKWDWDWENGKCKVVYGICCRDEGDIVKVDDYWGDTHIFEFPIREMRDAFYENFKELINECISLLQSNKNKKL